MAILIVFSIFTWLNDRKVGASTPGTTSDSSSDRTSAQRRVVVTSIGTIVAFFKAGTVSPTGLAYSTSTDGGSTWSAATQVDSHQDNDFSVAIDSSNNIYIAYDDLGVTTGALNVFFRKLTYSAGSWSIGSATNMDTGTSGSSCQSQGIMFGSTNISVTAAGKLVLSYSACEFGENDIISRLSTNSGSSWSGGYFSGADPDVFRSDGDQANIAIGNDSWQIAPNNAGSGFQCEIYKDIGTTGSWTDTGTPITNCDTHQGYSITSSTSNSIDIFYNQSGSGLKYVQYSISGNSLGSVTTISSSSSDVIGSISAGSSGKLYAFFGQFQASNSYKVMYETFDGVSTWSGPTQVTGSNTSNNFGVNSSANYANAEIGVIWLAGTASPWTVNGSSVTITAQSPPAAPTLSSPTTGSLISSVTPQLQMSATDPDSDTLKYDVLIYNTSANDGTNCTGTSFESADQNSSGTGWGNGTTAYSSGATATYTVQSAMTRGSSYCWQAKAKDPGGSNTFGSTSTPSTFTINSSPAAPTLNVPTSGAAGVSMRPLFQLRTTDANSDYLKYAIQIYSATACGGSQVGSDIDQTGSQTGWQRQNAGPGSNTAYTGAVTTSGSTMAEYQYSSSNTPLSPNHLYSWRAKAIDPGGSNTFGSYSSCQDFTTTTLETIVGGGINISGGTIVR